MRGGDPPVREDRRLKPQPHIDGRPPTAATDCTHRIAGGSGWRHDRASHHRGPARTHCRGPDRSRLRPPPHHSGPGRAPARRNHRSTGSLSWHAGYWRNNSGLADSRRRGSWHRRECATSGTCRCKGSIGQPRATRRGWCSRGRVPGDRLGEGPSRTRSRPWGDVGVRGAGVGRLDGRLGSTEAGNARVTPSWDPASTRTQQGERK